MSNKTKNILAKNILANNKTFETNSEFLKEDAIVDSIEEVEQKKDGLFLLTNINACLFLLTKEYLENDNDFELFVDNKNDISIDLSKENQQTGLLNINQLWDSQFDDDTSCWKSTRKNTDFTFGIDVSADWSLKHSHTAYLYQESAQTSEQITLIYHDPVIGDLLPVQVGENYAIGGCFACHRCDAALVVEFYDSNNEKVQQREFSISSEKLKGGRNLGDYLHIAESICIPDGVNFIRVVLIKLPTKIDSKPDNSFFFFTHLFFTLTENNCESEWSNNPFNYEDWQQLRMIKADDIIQISLPLPNDIFDNEKHIIKIKSTSIDAQQSVLSTTFYAHYSIYHWERFQLCLTECLASKNWKNAAKLLADWFNNNPQDMQSSGIQMFNQNISDKQSIFETVTIEALQVIRCLTELTPENAYAWQCLAEVNYQLKRWQECLNAYEAFSKLSELDKNNTEQFIVVLKKLYRYEDVCRVYLRNWAFDNEKEHLTSLLEVLRNCDGLQLSAEEIKWLCVANRKHAKTDVQKLMMEIIPRLSTQTLNELFMKLDNGYDLIIQSLTLNLEYAETKHNWAVALKILKVLDIANMINPLPDWLAIEMLWMAAQLEHLILVSDSALGMLYKENLTELKCLQPWQQAELFDQNFLLLDQNYLRYGQSWKQPPNTAITRLSQFLAQPESKHLSPHPLFDASWHNTNKNIRHSLVEFFRRSSGNPEKLPKPNPYFDCDWYKEHYLTDNQTQHPLLHYLIHFKEKGIHPNYYFNSDYVRETQCLQEDEEPLSYYLDQLKSGGAEFRLNGFSPSPFFDRLFYLEHNKDVLAGTKNGLDPFSHFIEKGIGEGRLAYDWEYYNKFVRHQMLEFEPNNLNSPVVIGHITPHLKNENAEKAYLAGQRILASQLIKKPLISIAVPVYQVNPRFLQEMIESVLAQTYENWQLCMVDDASKRFSEEIKELFNFYAEKDPRIVYRMREKNGHICHTTNDCLVLATGEFVALLDHDDLLTQDALYEVAFALNNKPDIDILYSDEDKVTEWGVFRDPYYKPDWSPHSLWSRMYTCHLTVYRKTLIEKAGGFRVGFEGSQDHDLMLRCSSLTANIYHIPRVLYHWRIHPESTSGGTGTQKDYCAGAGKRAVEDALKARGLQVNVELVKNRGSMMIAKPDVIGSPLVDIIIPSRNHSDILSICLESIFSKTTYSHIKVTVIDNNSTEDSFFTLISYWQEMEPTRFQVIRDVSPFNYSAINNAAVAKTTGDFLIFLNNDTEIISENWVEGMLGYAQLEEVGAVGVKLYYPDDTVQHAGVATGIGGVAVHLMKNQPRNEFGYWGNLMMVTNYSAVTAACLMISRNKFNLVGGFEEFLQVAFNDVDFCLKVRNQGLFNVYLPFVELYHHESKSRGNEDTPAKA